MLDIMKKRHSVRQYRKQKLEGEPLRALMEEVSLCNRESGLLIQLVTDEPQAFGGLLAGYGSFTGVENYFALIGPKGKELDAQLGYYGERLVLKAQALGLNTCWVAVTYRKGKCRCEVATGEKLVCVIALGFGENEGVPHKNRPMEELCQVEGDKPEWFLRGMEAAMLAPTALNRQNFLISLVGNRVRLACKGAYSGLDSGILRYHFEQGAGTENFVWEEA